MFQCGPPDVCCSCYFDMLGIALAPGMVAAKLESPNNLNTQSFTVLLLICMMITLRFKVIEEARTLQFG